MMSLTLRNAKTAHTLLRKVLAPGCQSHSIRGKTKKKFRKVLDPHHADDLSVFQYVGEKSRPDTLVFCWGISTHGGLGRASFLQPDASKKEKPLHYMHHPHRIEFGEYHKVVDLACGYGFTVFAVNDRSGPSCYGTGINTDSQLGSHQTIKGQPPGILISPSSIELPLNEASRVVKVAAGRAHVVMLTNTNSVWTVGNNAYGQCGRPIIPDEDYGRQPVYYQLKALDGVHLRQVECGQDTSFFVSEEGVVYSCGWGADGQTGRGHYNNEPNVGPVLGDIAGEKIVKVSCRADCALALNDKGDVFGWGNSEYHQLNSVTDEMQIHTSRRIAFPGQKKVIDIASAGTMCLLLDEEGQVYSWGFGPIGKGPNAIYSKSPTLIPSTLFGQNEITPDAKVTSVTCGINHFAALNSHGSLFTWGKNPGGCLGQRHKKDQYFPMRVCLGGSIVKVSCGVDHTAVLVKELV